ncbi:hypothetical protein Ct61P_15604 [Colletotrichum tofieldiae]|nr:hypothetical protein Ct61P_15604 [Colletotrichum tofieldiae]
MGSISLACPPARLRWGGRPTAGFSNFGGDFLARHRRHGHGQGTPYSLRDALQPGTAGRLPFQGYVAYRKTNLAVAAVRS